MSVTHIPQVAIETRHLYKRFGDVTALDDINLRIAQGEFVAIMGASGSGKTTLMNILTCLDTATEGQVFLDGTDAAALDEEGRRRFRAEKIGLVFQQFHLIPFLTALENIMLAQHYHSVVDEAAARKVLEQVGLGHRVTHLPSQLSGGEQQRVCIARALVNEPPVIFADEPTGNLGCRTVLRNDCKRMLARGKRGNKITVQRDDGAALSLCIVLFFQRSPIKLYTKEIGKGCIRSERQLLFLTLRDRCTIPGCDFRGQLCRHGGSLGDFRFCRSIGEILLAAAAVPIRNVAFLCSGGGLCVNVFQVGVVVRVRAAVAFFANLTDRLSYAGRLAAGVLCVAVFP